MKQGSDPGKRNKSEFRLFLWICFSLLTLAGILLCRPAPLFTVFVLILILFFLTGSGIAGRRAFVELELFPREKLIRIFAYGFLLPCGIWLLFRWKALEVLYPLISGAVFRYQLKKNRGGKLPPADACLNLACWFIILLVLTGTVLTIFY